MSPHIVWAQPSQWFRIFSSAFVHGGLMHIGFNMFNFVVTGPSLERRIGTLRLLNLVLVLVAALGALYMFVAFGALLAGFRRFWSECSVGFSGVIFALITIDSLSAPLNAQYDVWGVHIPARWYPWAMLAFTQLIMPNVSFIGHLVGILGAYLWHAHVLAPLLVPASWLAWAEDTLPLKIFQHPAWHCVGSSLDGVGASAGIADRRSACQHGAGCLSGIASRVRALCACLCGRGSAGARGVSAAAGADDARDVEAGGIGGAQTQRFFGSGALGSVGRGLGEVGARSQAVAALATGQALPARYVAVPAVEDTPVGRAGAEGFQREAAGHAAAEPSAEATARDIALLIAARSQAERAGASEQPRQVTSDAATAGTFCELPSHPKYPLTAAFGGGAPLQQQEGEGVIAVSTGQERAAALAAMAGVELLVEMGFEREEALTGRRAVGARPCAFMQARACMHTRIAHQLRASDGQGPGRHFARGRRRWCGGGVACSAATAWCHSAGQLARCARNRSGVTRRA